MTRWFCINLHHLTWHRLKIFPVEGFYPISFFYFLKLDVRTSRTAWPIVTSPSINRSGRPFAPMRHDHWTKRLLRAHSSIGPRSLIKHNGPIGHVLIGFFSLSGLFGPRTSGSGITIRSFDKLLLVSSNKVVSLDWGPSPIRPSAIIEPSDPIKPFPVVWVNPLVLLDLVACCIIQDNWPSRGIQWSHVTPMIYGAKWLHGIVFLQCHWWLNLVVLVFWIL